MYRKEDVNRLIANECSLEEAILITQYLDEHPELFSEYFTIDEWVNFKDDLKISHKQSSKMWQNISHNLFGEKKTFSLFKKLSVAASIVLIIAIGWLVYPKIYLNTSNSALSHSGLSVNYIENKKNTILSVTLPDSSMVELYPNSSLRYQEVNTNHYRGVVLSGEAIFSVKKDNSRPFKVFTDSLVTTVHGTKFRVQSIKGKNKSEVMLYEGCVSVKTTGISHQSSKTSYYLNPGDLFVYNKMDLTCKVTSSKSLPRKRYSMEQKNNQSSTIRSDNWYMFNNQPLSETLDQLSSIYGLKIEYKKNDIDDFTFIGKIDKSDSLKDVLSSIALLNHLRLEITNTGFILKK